MASTYSELLADIATWMVRDDIDTLAPKFVAMAEKRFNRVLRMPEMEQASTATIEAGTVTLPTDFIQARAVHLETDPRTPIEQMTLAQLSAAYPLIENGEGTPMNYALQSGNQMVFGPSPDEEYAVVLNYYAKIPALSDAAPTNWLLDSHDDLYLAAALAEGFAYTVDAERGPYWAGRMQEALEQLRIQGLKKAYSASPLRSRPQSAPSGRLSRY